MDETVSTNRLSKKITSIFDEDNEVKRLMMIHNIDNVRGGSYCKVKLTQEELLALKREITHATNKCFKCDLPGHYAKQCDQKSQHVIKCNLLGHYGKDCPEKYPQVNCEKDIKSKNVLIHNLDYCVTCGRKNHSKRDPNFRCVYKTTHERKPVKDLLKYCGNCGRDGHNHLQCFANLSNLNNIN